MLSEGRRPAIAGRVHRQRKIGVKPGDLLPSVTLRSTAGRDVDVAGHAEAVIEVVRQL